MLNLQVMVCHGVDGPKSNFLSLALPVPVPRKFLDSREMPTPHHVVAPGFRFPIDTEVQLQLILTWDM